MIIAWLVLNRSPMLQYYWMGLQSDRRSYPKFKWMDPMTPALSLTSSYKHWGEAPAPLGWHCMPIRAELLLPLPQHRPLPC